MMHRPWIGIVLGLLLVLGGRAAYAQSSADAFFHEAAQAYVEGDPESARRAVERGLERAPDDPRLQALRKKLEQQTKQQGGSSSRQGVQEGTQNQRSRGQQSRQQRSGESGKESRSQTDRPSDQRTSRSSDAAAAQARSASQRRGRRGERKKGRHALSRAQAARFLQALERQEMKLLREVQTRGQQSQTVEKDW